MITNKTDKMKENVVKVLNKWYEDYKTITESSRNEYMRSMKAGSTIPETGKIYGDYWQKEYEKSTSKFRDEALQVVKLVKNDFTRAVAEAPSEEALRAIQALEHLDYGKVETKMECEAIFDALMEKYGDNYLAHRAIKEKAYEADVTGYTDNEDMKGLMTCKAVEEQIEKAFRVGSTMTDGSISMMEMGINNAGTNGLILGNTQFIY